MFGSPRNVAEGDRVSITGGSHIRRAGIITKVLPRSYHVKFDVIEKPGEKSPVCVRAWNVKKTTPPSTSTPPAWVPDSVTSGGQPGRKKKRIGTVTTEDIAQVLGPVLKSKSSLTKDEWIHVAQAVENMFL